jgi:heat shock protein HslJ
MAATDLDNTTWKLVSYLDGASIVALTDDAEVTLTFQDGAAGGKSACNRYRCTVTMGDHTLTFGPTMGTKMACPPPLMRIESVYLRALETVAGWQVADSNLELRNGAGLTLLVFARA